MFDLNLGRVGLSPRPDYQPGQAAAPLDLMHCGGSLWVCTAPTTDAPAENHPAWMAAGLAGAGLVPLTKDLTLYVREDGDDNNTGLEDNARGAFRTPQAALNHVDRTYHLDVHTLTVNIGPGTFPRFVCPPCRMLSGRLVIQGAGSGTIIQAVDSNAVDLRLESGNWMLRNMTVHVRVTKSSTSTRNGILSYGGRVEVSNVHIRMDEEVSNGGFVYGISCRGGYLTIRQGVVMELSPPAGGTARLCALHAEEDGMLRMDGDMDISGAAYTTLRLLHRAYFTRYTSNRPKFTGSFEARIRYWIQFSSICHANSGDENFFPGTSPGILETGGQYFA